MGSDEIVLTWLDSMGSVRHRLHGLKRTQISLINAELCDLEGFLVLFRNSYREII